MPDDLTSLKNIGSAGVRQLHAAPSLARSVLVGGAAVVKFGRSVLGRRNTDP